MLHELTTKKNIRSFAVTAENPTGEKGKGGMLTEGIMSVQARELGIGWKISPGVNSYAHSTTVLADIKGMGAIRHIWITDNAFDAREMVLRIYFDGHDNPSVEAPLGDFFASANYNDHRTLDSLAVCINPKKSMNSYFEMPYRTGFKIEVENLSGTDRLVFFQIDCEEKEIGADALYFHAQFRRQNPTDYMVPYTILDGITGAGHYVGTYLYWGPKASGWWGEGEVKFYIDGDTDFPTICGTGTEDYFGGAWNFDIGGKFTEYASPYAGMYKIDKNDGMYKSQVYFNLYRWHINDPVYFDHDIRVTVQALGWRSENRFLPLRDDISSVAYWYSDTLDDVYPKFPSKDELELA